MLQRLQEEIIKQSDDHSIFAWNVRRVDQPGLLADNPSAFVNCSKVNATSSRKGRAPYTVTNRGLSLKLMAVCWVPDTYAARLECTYEQKSTKCLGIFLRRLDEDDQYARVAVNGRDIFVWPRSVWDDGMSETPRSAKLRGVIEINVRQKVTASNTNAFKERVNGFRIHREFFTREHGPLRRLRSQDELYTTVKKWREMDEETNPNMSQQFRLTNILRISRRHSVICAMILGFDFDHNPVCFMTASYHIMETIPVFEDCLYKRSSPHHRMYDRNAIDTFRWSKISGGIAESISRRSKTWVIKGDRIEGVQALVEGFGLLQIGRKETECGCLVWEVRRAPEHLCSPSTVSQSDYDDIYERFLESVRL